MNFKAKYDFVVIGSGFGGSLISLAMVQQGKTVLLLEKGRHPRFAIGESTSPLTNLLIEEFSKQYDIPELLSLTTYGKWKRELPDIGVGLKRGFTYFHHQKGATFTRSMHNANELLVAASPFDEVGDTHWLRSDVDHFLVKLAMKYAVDFLDQAEVTPVSGFSIDGVDITVRQGDEDFTIHADMIIDATGPGGFMSKWADCVNTGFNDYPTTHTLFTHFAGVKRCDDIPTFQPLLRGRPYEADNAALHHVFDGGWMWVLRFDNGITSAGIACESWLSEELKLSEREAGWANLMSRFPSIAEQFDGATPVLRFIYSDRLAYRSNRAQGPGWVMLPSAAAFIDPLFSTGIPLTLLGIFRLACVLNDPPGEVRSENLKHYEEMTFQESDYVAEFIAGCYGSFRRFELFKMFSMYYFAAASFAELSRRIPGARRFSRFMAADSGEFSSSLRHNARLLKSGECIDPSEFFARVEEGIDPINIAGLHKREKNSWYDVNLDDVVVGAKKLGIEPADIIPILQSADWAEGCTISAGTIRGVYE